MSLWIAWVAGLMTCQSVYEFGAGNYGWGLFFAGVALINAGFAYAAARDR